MEYDKRIDEMAVGDTVEGFYILKTAVSKIASNGRPYLNAVISDVSGAMDAKVWDYGGPISAAEEGKVVKIRGTVGEYRGTTQMTVDRIRLAQEQDNYDLSLLVPVAPIDRDAALIDIVEARNQIDQRGLARPRLPHQSDGFAFGTHQIDVFQNPIFAVFEPNVVETNFGIKLVDFERIILLFQRIVGFQHVIDTLQRGHAFLNTVHGFR